MRADERVRPLAEVDATGRANGVAEAAGLLNPKLKPVVDADVVAGVPVSNKQTNGPYFTITVYALYSLNQDPYKTVSLPLQIEQGYMYL